jgi:hypothetical protein
MKTQKTRVSNSPRKLRLLETSQPKFLRYQKKIRKYRNPKTHVRKLRQKLGALDRAPNAMVVNSTTITY